MSVKCVLIKVRTIFFAEFISLLHWVLLLWKKKFTLVTKTHFSMSLSSFSKMLQGNSPLINIRLNEK